jgi:P27 family predicted phage terminase small subunit
MPNRPKPTRLKLLEGNPGKRPIPENEPHPISPLPEPPSHLDPYALEEWQRLAPALHNLGLLFDVDAQPFAAYCVSFSRWRKAEEKIAGLKTMVEVKASGNSRPSTLIGIANEAARDMVRYASEFGLTPSSRARLGVSPKRKESKFRGLIKVF